ncbi:MAG TPA: XRE family transcriptional regulator [Kofleriaceae bacterium]
MANTREELGKRIASARKDRRLTQAELADALVVDRTAITKMEAGERKVDSLELAKLAEVLRRPAHWFVSTPQPSVVSRRAEREDAVRREDLELETLALDVEQVVQLGGLAPMELPAFSVTSIEDSEDVAKRARALAGLSADEPVWDIINVVERLGLFAFVLALDQDVGAPAEGSYVALARGGVGLISAAGQSGRRRFTIAHELGHHVLADQYAPEWVLGAGSSEREKIVNAFAIHFLMPREAVTARWMKHEGAKDPRPAAIRIAAEFGMSWSAACAQLERLGYLTHRQYAQLEAAVPGSVDFVEQQVVIRDDVKGPRIPSGYAAAVIRALRSHKIGPDRATELLHGTIDKQDLPAPRTRSLDEMTAELGPLP